MSDNQPIKLYFNKLSHDAQYYYVNLDSTLLTAFSAIETAILEETSSRKLEKAYSPRLLQQMRSAQAADLRERLLVDGDPDFGIEKVEGLAKVWYWQRDFIYRTFACHLPFIGVNPVPKDTDSGFYITQKLNTETGKPSSFQYVTGVSSLDRAGGGLIELAARGLEELSDNRRGVKARYVHAFADLPSEEGRDYALEAEKSDLYRMARGLRLYPVMLSEKHYPELGSALDRQAHSNSHPTVFEFSDAYHLFLRSFDGLWN